MMLPALAEASNRHVAALLRKRSAEPLSDDPPAMIYVVDDDEAVRDSLRLLLIAMGFPVEEFGCGEAFFARAAPDQGKCLILDMNLPGANGLEILARLRAEGSTLPVVMVSGCGDQTARRRAHELGAAAFLDKPVASALLRKTITGALARSAESSSA